jgi:hypothetical protein
MQDLDKALADISTIRDQIAAGTAFRGYGPAALAATGGLALLTALAQSLWLENPTAQPLAFFACWAGAAAVSIGLIWIEMRRRAHRHHSGLADAMIHQAIEQFLPAAAAGVLLPLLLLRFAPDALWMVTGLWQLLVGLGIFASVRSLPRAIALAGAWYFVAGMAVLMIAGESRMLSPWAMGVPFAIGQLLMAGILYLSGKSDAES